MTPTATPAYTFEKHRHRFLAWAAARAASVKNCRFPVSVGLAVIEHARLNDLLAGVEMLPEPHNFDDAHKSWRDEIIAAAETEGYVFSHGVAAKLINVYLKGAFVISELPHHKNVNAIHPPVDRLLLHQLAKNNVGSLGTIWKAARDTGWSKLTSDQYADVINNIRKVLGEKPLWMIEEYWPGHR